MDAAANHRIVARDLRRRLVVWDACRTDLWKKYDRLERLYRKAFGDDGLARRTDPLAERVAALGDALDKLLDT